MFRIDNVSFSSVGTSIKEFGATVKKIFPRKQTKSANNNTSDDKFNRTDSEPRSAEERTRTAVMKSNEQNRERLVAEINRSGEIDSVYDKLLPEYIAYQNPELKDFTLVSADTVSAVYKKKPVEIKFSVLEDGNDQQEINFHDGSQISYITYTQDGKLKINEEEFEIPAGTIIETKSINGRMFSRLIQTPDMQRKVIDKPEYLEKAEEVLATYVPPAPEPAPAPAPEPTEEASVPIVQVQTEEFLNLTKNQKNNI